MRSAQSSLRFHGFFVRKEITMDCSHFRHIFLSEFSDSLKLGLLFGLYIMVGLVKQTEKWTWLEEGIIRFEWRF
jgi:hypothetical protein